MIHYLVIPLAGELQIWRAVRFRARTHVKPHFSLIIGIELERLHGAAVILRKNMLIYGVGGILIPFVFIKLIDVALVALHLAP